MTSEIRWLLVLVVLYSLLAVWMGQPQAKTDEPALDVLLGPAQNFTTRWYTAHELMEHER